MGLWKRKQIRNAEEARFQKAFDLFKDLDRREFNRLMDGLKLAWEGYYKIRQVQTTDEKETAEDIAKIDMDYQEH